MILGLFTFLLALGLGLYLTPLAIRAALKLGMVAESDGDLRKHGEPVPYLGGVAVFLALLISLAVSVDFSTRILGLLLGTSIILMVGLIDDFGVMDAKVKLFGQIVAAIALIKGGVVLELEIFKAVRWPGDLPLLSWALSVVWLVGIANAFNFLDIEDGLAAGVAAACCPALIAVAWINHRMDAALFTIALFGSVLGFLRYNAPLPKAKIYLGDAGSLLLGLSLAALAMTGSYTDNNDLGAVCPIIILGVACFEMGVTMAARLRRGIPVWHGSPDHVAKRLQRLGLSARGAVVFHIVVSLLLGCLALAVMLTDIQKSLVLVSVIGLVGIVVAVFMLRVKVEWK